MTRPPHVPQTWQCPNLGLNEHGIDIEPTVELTRKSLGWHCDTCGLPMTWSHTQRRMWCCVYGDHRPHAYGAELVRLCVAAPNTTRSAIRLKAIRHSQRYLQHDDREPSDNSHGCAHSATQDDDGTMTA